MADGDRERIGGVLVRHVDPEDEPDHPLNLCLFGAPVAAHCLLHVSGRVLSGRDAGAGAGDENGSSRLPDRERDAGVGADVRLLQCHRIRGVLGHECGDSLEDRLEAQIQALTGAGGPAPVDSGPEAPFALLDDAVSARCRSGVDAEDFHADTLSTAPDDPPQAETCTWLDQPATVSSTRSGMSKFE